MRHFKYICLLIVAAGFIVTGCGGGSDISSPTTVATQDPQASLEDAAREWSESFYGGDGVEAYALFTDECKQDLTEDQFKAMSDFNDSEPTRELQHVDATVKGNTGTVDLHFNDTSQNDTGMPWVLVGEEWKTSDCTMRE
ncbi:hypothetical protein GDN83_06975 [Gordonia jinghuaiqii]|uniref:Nuclear transport factor 2 family protein n=1 Tax=Gordonia jinghuaiqii TaxID=2758710 RepID=A0A7D7LYX0_9ACTN|nr:hypothetical protein [Gordonia jinghuaiqii]MCR5977483.1 hypothetical protein [Gordonia jinghuaiqii]QMT02174.1 hypothetical protein H1R19_03055 [Gordonia jinghuaiqii]